MCIKDTQGRNSILSKSEAVRIWGLYTYVSRGKAKEERVLMGKQMTFLKDKWALWKLDGDLID